MGNPTQQKDVGSGIRLGMSLLGQLGKEWGKGAVAQRGEIETLVGIEVKLLGQDVVVNRLQLLGTLGDEDNLCSPTAIGRLAQASGG